MINDHSEDYMQGHKDGYLDGEIEGFNQALSAVTNIMSGRRCYLYWEKRLESAEEIKKLNNEILDLWKR